MKRQKIVELISNRLKVVNNTSRKLKNKFKYLYLDTFIIEIKKFKSLLHLIEAKNNARGICLPMPLKALYGYCSIIRNYQVNRKDIANWLTDGRKGAATFYLKNIEDAEKYWQVKALELMKYDLDMTCQRDILKKIPKKLSKSTISNLVQMPVKRLKNVKVVNDEISIRSVHKILEDIYYNRKYLSPTVVNGDAGITCLNQFICQIEEFENISIRLEFLSGDYLNQIKDSDVKVKLIEIRTRLIGEKQNMIARLGNHFKIMFSTL